MSGIEKFPSITVNFGDVVEDDDAEQGVLVDVQRASFSVAQIVEIEGKTYLTTFGTTYGRLRHVEGAKRWTPLEIATGVTDGLWEKDENGEIPPSQRADYELAVNSLLRSLIERSKQSPWTYPQE